MDYSIADRSSVSVADSALFSLTSKSVEALSASSASRHLVLIQMQEYCRRLKLNISGLRVIHIAGTKGKGSTAAFCESIARAHGLTTGLYSSPHLVSVTERFRLNGATVDDALYLRHFWRVWDSLRDYQAAESAVPIPQFPMFFRFLTLVALSLFSESRVDCLILEVGMGGRLDSTNIFHSPELICCGLSALGFDHMEVLGPTLTHIGREKGGICKSGVPAFTLASQIPEALEALRSCAREENTELTVLSETISPSEFSLGLAGAHQYENATLAIALMKSFFARSDSVNGRALVPELISAGLKNVRWAGRCQILPHQTQSNLTFYIDGAHTDASVELAVNWFKQVAGNNQKEIDENKSIHENTNINPTNESKLDDSDPDSLMPTHSLITHNTYYSLLFNCGHVRNPFDLLSPIIKIGIPNTTAAEPANQENSTATPATSQPSKSNPIQFGHIVSAPFDHDRPHLLHAPTIDQLCDKYEKPEFQSFYTKFKSMNPEEKFHSNRAAGNETKLSWQNTLFQAWDIMVQSQFYHARRAVAAPPSFIAREFPHRCESYSSVSLSVARLVRLAQRHPRVQFKVLVTGSLYLVGNLFQALKFKP